MPRGGDPADRWYEIDLSACSPRPWGVNGHADFRAGGYWFGGWADIGSPVVAMVFHLAAKWRVDLRALLSDQRDHPLASPFLGEPVVIAAGLDQVGVTCAPHTRWVTRSSTPTRSSQRADEACLFSIM